MGTELEPITTAPLARQTRKKLTVVERDALVSHTRMIARERQQLHRAALRIEGTYNLAEYASQRATRLNRGLKNQSIDNPGLEMIHREFEQTAAHVAGLIIFNYGTGND